MGKKIDRAVCAAAALLSSCLYFLWAFGRLLPALACAFLFTLCLYRLAAVPRGWMGQKRARRAQARRLVDSWPARPPREGKKEALALVQSLGPLPEGVRVVFLPFHASRPLTVEDVLRARREGDGPLLILCASPAARAALSQARACPGPVRALDRDALIRLAEKRPDLPPPPKTEKKRLSLWPLVDRLNPLRAILFGASSLAMYVFSGSLPCLLAGAALLILSALRLSRPRPEKALF